MEIQPVPANNSGNRHQVRTPLRTQLFVVWFLLFTMTLLPIYVEGGRSFLAWLLRLQITEANRNILSLAAFSLFILIAWCWKRSFRHGLAVQGSILLLLVAWLWSSDRSVLATWAAYAPKVIGVACLVAATVSGLVFLQHRRRSSD